MPLVGPAAILIVGVGAWFVQVCISKKRATIDFISHVEIGNPEWQKATHRFSQLTRNGGLTSLASGDLDADKLEDRRLVAYLLDHCQVVAVAIREGVFNEKIYRSWNYSRYIKYWDKAQGYIGDYRTKNQQPKAYAEFEQRANKWSKVSRTN